MYIWSSMDLRVISMSRAYLVEAAVETLGHAKASEALGVDRIELCGALSGGGITPSIGLAKSCCGELTIPVHAMIRPRSGSFVYSETEIQVMMADIRSLAEVGVRGVVLGCLDSSGKLEHDQAERLKRLCDDLALRTTFHRAIDVSHDPKEILRAIIELNFDNVLTSGGAMTAFEGRENIRAWVEEFGEKINIMAGSGIKTQNVRSLVDVGVSAVHLSVHKKTSGSSEFDFGDNMIFDEERLTGVLNAI